MDATDLVKALSTQKQTASLEEILLEKLLSQNSPRISPWLAVIIGFSSFFVGAVFVAVIVLGVYLFNQRQDAPRRVVQYVTPEQVVPRQVPVAPVGTPRIQDVPPPVVANTRERPESLVQRNMDNSSGLPQTPTVTPVGPNDIMLKPAPHIESRSVKQYPVVIPKDTYAVPPGVTLENSR